MHKNKLKIIDKIVWKKSENCVNNDVKIVDFGIYKNETKRLTSHLFTKNQWLLIGNICKYVRR
jgi:hypothetical protein